MRMHYVIYLEDADEHIVIPYTWIRDAEKMLRKFVNYGINTSQTHLCFWSTLADAITPDGRPNSDYQPNFASPLKTEYPCDEGTFRCRVIKFTTDYDDAYTFAEDRRERLPPRYYQRRVLERPLPNLEPTEDGFAENNDDAIVDRLPAFENNAPNDLMVNDDNIEREELIPRANKNPVVLLERIFVGEQSFEAVYEASPEEPHEMQQSSETIDPLGNANDEETIGIKFEIEHEFNEVDGILDDANMIDSAPIKQEMGARTVDNIERSQLKVQSASGSWEVEDNSSIAASSSGRGDGGDSEACGLWKVENSLNVAASSSGRGGGADSVQPMEAIMASPAVEPKNEISGIDRASPIFEAENVIHSVDTHDGSAIGSDQSGQENLNGNDVPHVNGENINDEANVNGDDDVEASLDDGWIQADEDVYYFTPKTWPSAKTFELKGFVKRENDRFSGDLPFSLKTKNNLTCREYIVGFDRVVKIPLPNVNTCIKWSASPFVNDISYDKKIALAMLRLSHTKRELSLGKTNGDAVEFVKHLLNVRVQGDLERVAKLPEYIQELLQQIKDKK